MIKNPYIVKWNHSWLKLSDGSTHKEFFDHDEAMKFIEDEIKKVSYPLATKEKKQEYRESYHTEPTQGQIQCSRLNRGVILLYGVSDFYIVPSKVDGGVLPVKS